MSEGEIAEAIIEKMKENGRWEALRVELASTLRVNNDFKYTEKRAQEILATEQLRKMMKLPNTTVYDIAKLVERSGGIQNYASSLRNILDETSQTGLDLQREVSDMVDEYTQEHRI